MPKKIIKQQKNMARKPAIVFVIAALILGAVGLWYFQRNIYSKETLKLEILAPGETNLAEEVEYIVKYKNNGNIRLEKPKLIFEYPRNSIPSPPDSEIMRQEKEIDDIYPGEEETFRFKARLLGRENDVAVAKAWLNYQPKNLRARYESATTLTTSIKGVPITFEFDLLSRIESGRDIQFRLNYFSNVNYPLSDLRVQVEYPDGFEFLESTPKGIEDNEWEIEVMNKSEGGRIEISGKLSGEKGTQRTFKAIMGIWKDGEFIPLKEITKAIVLIEPSLYIHQQINGNPEYVASPGDQLHYEIYFKNIGNDPLTDLFLIVRLEGDLIDFQTIKSNQGRFESGDNSIVFDGRQVSKLKFLDAQEEERVEFWLELKRGSELTGPLVPNPAIKNKVFLSQAQKEFVTKVNTDVELIQKGFFQDEVFGNSGPIPPKVGEVTTYTIMWQVKNFYGELKNARVKATLPSGVRLTGEIFPEDQKSKFAFDPKSREIVWELGDLEPGTGISSPSPNISFQIAFAPDNSQRGQIATIINEAQVVGEDSWTGQTLSRTAPLIDTTLPDDPSVTEETGIVQ